MRTELIEHLFNNLPVFQERLQSFIDQIPKAKDATAVPAKDGFFISFFLGMFADLNGAGLKKKLKVNNIHFKVVDEDGTKCLIVVVDTTDNSQKNFVFFESKNKKSVDDLTSLIGKNKISNIDLDSVTRVLVGRKQKNEDKKKWDFKVLTKSGSTGKPYITTAGYEKIKVNSSFVKEDDIKKLATEAYNTCEENTIKILEGATNLYSSSKIKDKIDNSEAVQHGFLSGILINFRYRHNLKLYLELMIGKGFSDVSFLVRGKERILSAVPIVIELKKDKTASQALKEMEEYVEALPTNKVRFLTDAHQVVCVGANFNYHPSYKTSNSAKEIKENKEPAIQKLFNDIYSHRNDSDLSNLNDSVKNLLVHTDLFFPSGEKTHKYLSWFLLGQLHLVENNKKTQAYIFTHEGNIARHLSTIMLVNNNHLIIFNLAQSGRNLDFNKHFAQNILDTLNNQNNIKSITKVDALITQSEKNVTCTKKEVNEAFSQGDNMFQGSIQKIDDRHRRELMDSFKNVINYQKDELCKNFNTADTLSSRIDIPEGYRIKTFFENEIKGLMFNEGRLRDFAKNIASEINFQAFLDGLLTGLSNLHFKKHNELVAVIPQFQVGGDKKADIAIQLIDMKKDQLYKDRPFKKKKDLRESTLVGLELKYNLTESDEKKLLDQMQGYVQSKNIKSITEGNKVAFIGVILNSNDNIKSLKVTDKLVIATVQHSSMAEKEAKEVEKAREEAEIAREEAEIAERNAQVKKGTRKQADQAKEAADQAKEAANRAQAAANQVKEAADPSIQEEAQELATLAQAAADRAQAAADRAQAAVNQRHLINRGGRQGRGAGQRQGV